MYLANIEKAIRNIEFLARDVNVNEICGHIKRDNLVEWITAWKKAMDEQLNNIKEALK